MNRVGYARKSQTKQDITTQLNKLHDEGIQTDCIFSDSISGGTEAATRPGYRAMLDRLAAGDINEVVVTEYSRVGRDTIDTLSELLGLSKRGIKITSLSANEAMLSTAPKELQPILLSAISLGAELERQHNRERVCWVLTEIREGRRKSKSGKPIGRPPVPIDWDRIKATKEKYGVSENMARKLCEYSKSNFYKQKALLRRTNGSTM